MTAQTWPQFWYALSGGTDEKVHATSYDELQGAIAKWLEDQTPEGQLRLAEEELDYEVRWYGHEYRP